jgi:hypothetical protein
MSQPKKKDGGNASRNRIKVTLVLPPIEPEKLELSPSIEPERLKFPHGKLPVAVLADAYGLNGEDANRLIAHAGTTIDFYWILDAYDGTVEDFRQYYELLDNFEYRDIIDLKKRISHCTYRNKQKRAICKAFALTYIKILGSCVNYLFLNKDDVENDCEVQHNIPVNKNGYPILNEDYDDDGAYCLDEFEETVFFIFRDLSLVNTKDSIIFLNENRYEVRKEIKLLCDDMEIAAIQQLHSIKDTAEAQLSHPSHLPIIVQKCLALPLSKGDTGSQMKTTLDENREAYNQIQDLLSQGKSILDIVQRIRGGRRVMACLLFPSAANPAAAYKQLIRAEEKHAS